MLLPTSPRTSKFCQSSQPDVLQGTFELSEEDQEGKRSANEGGFFTAFPYEEVSSVLKA